MILKRFSMAMTISHGTRSLEMARFLTLSLADSVFLAALFRHRRVGMGSLQTLIAAVDNGCCLRI
jgi:hypothetical protein